MKPDPATPYAARETEHQSPSLRAAKALKRAFIFQAPGDGHCFTPSDEQIALVIEAELAPAAPPVERREPLVAMLLPVRLEAEACPLVILGADGRSVARAYGDQDADYAPRNLQASQRARQIVVAVNHHEALVSALSQIIFALPRNRDWLDPELEKYARAVLREVEGAQ